VVQNPRQTLDRVVFFGFGQWIPACCSIYALAAQTWLVSVTDYDDEPISAAECNRPVKRRPSMKRSMLNLMVLALLLCPAAVVAQDEVLTCGKADCSELGNPFAGLDAATADRMRSVVTRLEATSYEQWIEIVALAIGQVGCFEGWPSVDKDIQDYYDAAMIKLVRNIGLAPDEAAFVEEGLWDVFFDSVYSLGEQGRLVTVTGDEYELIPAACAAG
jgi:hypothetical protein